MTNKNTEYLFNGKHFFASYLNCQIDKLKNIDSLRNAMYEAVIASGATILSSSEHIFDTGGYTLAIVLSESHATIHTYPEFNSCFVDLFTCGDNCCYEKFNLVISDYLETNNINFGVIKRDHKFQILTQNI